MIMENTQRQSAVIEKKDVKIKEKGKVILENRRQSAVIEEKT